VGLPYARNPTIGAAGDFTYLGLSGTDGTWSGNDGK